MKSLKKVLRKKKFIKIKLKKIVTNHLELEAKINGVKGRFILDTGASNSCVGLDLIEHFNLISEESEIKAAGAGATGMETQKSENNTLKIGKWKTDSCHLVLFDLTHVNTALTQHNAKEVHGIIGADILESGKALIDYDKKALFLKKLKKKRFKKYSKLSF
ncbi:acid protease [Tenacibaculum todarodis]|uniref:Acid protease n=1 Tax=Tenacibaculum todarodis TaxID=1850252 RepID=A0A1L3JKF1_9FLAO|nr:retropepsin-like aspartic protease [Tenacibaculum todarodis]APG65625.1 acid protease [Tenacibaculum todarodis]